MHTLRATILVMALSAATHAAADEFAGGYLGGDVGVNRSSTSGTATAAPATVPAYGLGAGYGWNVGSTVVFGVEGFAAVDSNTAHAPAGQQFGHNTLGLGLKIGVPLDNLMPYARLGYDHTQGTGALAGFNAGSANGGVGLMYKFAPSWSLEGEWSASTPSSGGLKLKSNSVSIGLNYHFGSSSSGSSASSRK